MNTIEYLENQKYTGWGKLSLSGGRVYVGDIINGKCFGRGKLTGSNGDVYEGDFVNNKRTGKGKITFADSTIYDGVGREYGSRRKVYNG